MKIKLPKRGTMAELIEALALALVENYQDHSLEICEWTKTEVQKLLKDKK